MKRALKVRTSYRTYSNDKLDAFVQAIIDKTDNDDPISDWDDRIVELKSCWTEFNKWNAIASPKSSKLDREVRDNSRGMLLIALRRFAETINTSFQGEIIPLIASGLELYKNPEPSDEVGTAASIRILPQTEAGCAKIIIEALKYAMYYLIEIGTLAEDNETIIWGDRLISTKTTNGTIICGLIPGKTYFIRYCGVKVEKRGQWSPVVKFILGL